MVLDQIVEFLLSMGAVYISCAARHGVTLLGYLWASCLFVLLFVSPVVVVNGDGLPFSKV